ncbi:transcriptional regulator [Leptospira kmetyi]|uniref:Transcriptional regulator n=1 Tax=Leptospira kmetyi TaxID=408139 RepID=A0ABX4N8D9_9LEPT|nr:transcriptional regulator [Leptospira kmetyi]
MRLKKKITQEGAAGLKIGLRTYQRIESAEASPNIESIFLIAQNLGVHPKEIFEVSLEEKTKSNSHK